jgi:two-component system response regulator
MEHHVGAHSLLMLFVMTSHPSILLIDDSPGECELFRLALHRSGFDVQLYTEHHAAGALRVLESRVKDELLILLDWHLHDQRGDVFLKQLRAHSNTSLLPIVIFTTSDDAADMTAAYAHGANGYVIKPATFDELIHCAGDICRYWLARNRTPHRVEAPC